MEKLWYGELVTEIEGLLKNPALFIAQDFFLVRFELVMPYWFFAQQICSMK